MTSRARSAALLAALLAVLAGVSGCRTSPGAAAVVGDDRISTEHLQAEVAHALRDPAAEAALGSDLPGFTRTELGRLIQNLIIGAAAERNHLTVTTSEVDGQIQQFSSQAGGLKQLQEQAAQTGIAKDRLRSFIRFYVLEQKLGDQLVADVPVQRADLEAAYQQNIDQYDTVHAAHILVKSKKTADRLLAQVRADPKRFAELAAQYSTDTGSRNNGGDLGTQPQSQFVPAFGRAVFSAKVGSYIEVHTQFGWHVVHVIAHDKTPLSAVSDELKSTVLQNSRDRLLSDALRAEAKRLGVHVNPRYGRWDPEQGAVVPVREGSGPTSP